MKENQNFIPDYKTPQMIKIKNKIVLFINDTIQNS